MEKICQLIYEDLIISKVFLSSWDDHVEPRQSFVVQAYIAVPWLQRSLNKIPFTHHTSFEIKILSFASLSDSPKAQALQDVAPAAAHASYVFSFDVIFKWWVSHEHTPKLLHLVSNPAATPQAFQNVASQHKKQREKSLGFQI